MKKLYFIWFVTLANLCFGQSTYVIDANGNIIAGSHIVTTPGSAVKIIDPDSGMYFVLDSTHTTIEAFNESGESVWKTNPHKDYKLETYRTDNPYIVYFDFTKNYWCAKGFVEKRNTSNCNKLHQHSIWNTKS